MAFNGRFVLNVAHYAAKVGGDLARLIAITGLDETSLCEESCVLENEAYNEVIATAIEQTGDTAFGLHVGQGLNLAAAGLIGQITQSAESVKQALELCCEYANLGCSSLPMSLIEEDNNYKVTLEPNSVWQQQSQLAVNHTSVGVIAFMIREFHTLTRYRHYPIAVYLTIDGEEDRSQYEEAFGCTVHFNSNELAVLLEKGHVEDKIVTSDFNLLRILVAHAQAKSAELSEEKGFADLVKESILNLVKPEFPSIEVVAEHLNVSARTLQRRLKEEGQTYKDIIDSLRKEFAANYLKRDDLHISEVAYLLNYADASAFNRSFKRWFNQTPQEYRNSLAD